jgi:hypothetical protein
MNYKLNSYLSILAIACAVAVPLLSANAHELPVQAALTAPASYDLNYQYDALYEETFVLGTSSLGSYIPLYTRTVDGIYYNYSTTIDNTDSSILPLGLEITMTYNRSDTNWFSITGGYLPADTKIGTSLTGVFTNKIYFEFSNQTNKDYRLYFDLSSQTAFNQLYNYQIDSISYGDFSSGNMVLYYTTSYFVSLLLPSYSTLKFSSSETQNRYFDAWYLQDLGVSSAYDAGYDVGEGDGYADGLANNPNVLINAVESLIGMFVNFTFILFSLEMFGVSILSIVGVLFGIVAIVWILKTIRG